MDETGSIALVVMLFAGAAYLLVGALKSFYCLLWSKPYRWALWDGGLLLRDKEMGWPGSLAVLVARLVVASFLISFALWFFL